MEIEALVSASASQTKDLERELFSVLQRQQQVELVKLCEIWSVDPNELDNRNSLTKTFKKRWFLPFVDDVSDVFVVFTELSFEICFFGNLSVDIAVFFLKK